MSLIGSHLRENPTYTAANATRGTILATRIKVAATSLERRQGLLKSERLQSGDGLWIAPCEAIHTIGMRWPIDVVFLDGGYRIRKIARELAPWRMAVCFTGSSVLELPVGILDDTDTQIGDFLVFSVS
jgi:uncharacterized membrane protein (UPF0127 family)